MNIDEALERSTWDLFWLPPWAEIVNRPELLYTRSSRDLVVLNHVYRVRSAPQGIPALVDEVSAAYDAVRSRWMLGPGSQSAALDDALVAGGWTMEALHHGFAARPDSSSWAIRPTVEVRRVADRSTLLDAIAVSSLAFGRDPEPVPDDRVQDELAWCSSPNGRVHRFVAYDRATGTPMSAGGLNVYPELGLGMLWGGGTAPAGRGQGAYGGVLASRMRHAATLGLQIVGVYARQGTSAPIVAHHGFARHGPMITWVRERRS